MKRDMSKSIGIMLPAAVFILFVMIACSENPPSIQQLSWQLTLVDDREINENYESLSLWVHAVDEDGVDDLEYIYIVQSESELMWELSPDTWRQVSRNGEEWVGDPDIRMADGSNFPRGSYRVIVTDIAGERDFREFILSVPETDRERYQFPDVSLENGSLQVTNLGDKGFTVWLFDAVGKYITTYTPSGGNIIPFNTIFDNDQIRERTQSIHIYSYDHDRGIGIRSGPYPTEQ